MLTNETILDTFERIAGVVHRTVEGLDETALAYRPQGTGNPIGWLIWHLARVQDDHIAGIAGQEQVWMDGWARKFDLPFEDAVLGYGQTSDEVSKVRVSVELLTGYFDAVHEATKTYVSTLNPKDYAKVVDTNWNPPVTLGVRLVSIISDDLQHAGQAAYVKGLLP
jgi:hypothetical protein